MSHNNGIAAIGWLKIVDDQKFPPHDFFTPGAQYPVRIRHAMVSFLDDAMIGFRSIALKFSHHHFQSPFDLEMNTGERSVFWSAVSFLKFAKLKQQKWGVEYVEYSRQYPDGLLGMEKALRKEPKSYHDQRYYSKTPFLYISSDGIKHYAKYKVMPFDNEEETGVLIDPDPLDINNQRVLPHETRGRNYLKDEYEKRISGGKAKYKLQIQTRMAQDDDDPSVFNCMVLWDERIYPYYDLATFEIEKTLDWKESNLTSFSVNNMPKSLGIIPATSVFDYNSLNYMRSHSTLARKARLFSYRVFGMVPKIPDNDNRNVDNWGE
jgi:arachidonate 5-lipoxygenase